MSIFKKFKKLVPDEDRPSGRVFEDAFIESLKRNRKKFGHTLKIYQGGSHDLYEGTDFSVWGIKFDVTIRSNKDNCTYLGSTEFSYDYKRYYVSFYSARTGNGHRKFDPPVVVIHIDADPRRDDYEDIILAMDKEIYNIVYVGRRLFEDNFK